MPLTYIEYTNCLKKFVKELESGHHSFTDKIEKQNYQLFLKELNDSIPAWDAMCAATTLEELSTARDNLKNKRVVYPEITGSVTLENAKKYKDLLEQSIELVPTNEFYYGLSYRSRFYDYYYGSVKQEQSADDTKTQKDIGNLTTAIELAENNTDLTRSVGVELQDIEVDNPGQGNCAFYAFAIALINIIHQENSYGNQDTLNRWIGFDSNIQKLREPILNFDLKDKDNQLLDYLQGSLRNIAYDTQLEGLRDACSQLKANYVNRRHHPNYLRSILSQSTFVNFCGIYYGNGLNDRTNPFVNSELIRNRLFELKEEIEDSIAEQKATLAGHFSPSDENVLEQEKLAQTFIELLYGPGLDIGQIDSNKEFVWNSPILQDLAKVKESYFWGTHLDLDHLAIAFNVNFHPLQNDVARQEFNDLLNRHTVIINNKGNMHWTTKLTIAKANNNNKQLSETEKAELKKAEFLTPGEDKNTAKKEDKASAAQQSQSASSGQKATPTATTPVRVDKADYANLPLPVVSAGAAAEKESEKEAKQLDTLKKGVQRAFTHYVDYSNTITFSLFHHHGKKGRERAKKFEGDFSKITSLDEANRALTDFLKKDVDNGNTHPHSFRTMLLQEILALSQKNTVNVPSLEDVSKYYPDFLNTLSGSNSDNGKQPKI